MNFDKFKPENKRLLSDKESASEKKEKEPTVAIALRVTVAQKKKAQAKAKEDGYTQLAPALVRILKQADYL